MRARKIKRIKWRMEAFSHSALAGLLCRLPVETVFRIGEFLGHLIWPLVSHRQKIIERNLRIAEKWDPITSRSFAKKVFIRSIANLLSSNVSTRLSPKDVKEILYLENPELFLEAQAKGKGVILLLAHMGNWELLSRLHYAFPSQFLIGGMYRPLNNPYVDEKVLRERESGGAQMFSKRNNFLQITQFLRKNGTIGILADQRVGIQGDIVSFFGRLTRASPLPSLLARRCKCEVLALSFRTTQAGRWSASFHPVALPYNTQNCMNALEGAMRVSMVDQFWLQERFKIFSRRNRCMTDWLGDADITGEKHHRVLVWLKSDEAHFELPASAEHPDVVHEFAIDREIKELEALDHSKIFPFDYIIAFSPNLELRKEAKRLCIPLIFAKEFA